MKKPNKSVTLLDRKAKTLADTFATLEGRRPRILLSHIENKQHEHDIKIIASAYADLGFDVDLAPVFHSPKDLSKQAIENDVSVLYLISVTQQSIPHLLEITKSLADYGTDYILLVADTVSLSKVDYTTLKGYGVHVIIDESCPINKAAISILNLLLT